MWSSMMTNYLVSVYDIQRLHLLATLVSFGNISLRMGPIWTGHMIAWLSLAGSKHNLTFHLVLILVKNVATFYCFIHA